MSGRLEQVYLPSDSRLEMPGEGPLFELDFNKWWGGGKMWALFQSLPWPLFTSGLGLGQIWHWSKSLSNVAEYCYQIC